jgi:hypothetical protein
MKTITEAEYTATFDDVLAEVFELVVGQSAYLEVLSNETDYVGSLITYSNQGFHNATCVFELIDTGDHHDTGETRKKYAYQLAVEQGRATQTFFAYESLGEAKRHAMQLLTKELATYEEAESDLSRVARFETINDLLGEDDKQGLKLAYEAADEESENLLAGGNEKIYEDIAVGLFAIDCILEPRQYAC